MSHISFEFSKKRKLNFANFGCFLVMQKLLLIRFQSNVLRYLVIATVRNTPKLPKFLPYPKSNMATTYNKLTRLSFAQTKMLTLQARWLSPKAYFLAEKKNREAVTSKKRTMNEVVHAGLFHWKKYWLIPQICLLLTCHPEGVLFWGKARKSTDGEKGKQISLLLKPMSKNWPPKNSWATDHVLYWA